MKTENTDNLPRRAPLGELERTLIDTFIRERGFDPARLEELPETDRHTLLQEASTYASIRLSEIESRSHLVHELHGTKAESHPAGA